LKVGAARIIRGVTTIEVTEVAAAVKKYLDLSQAEQAWQ